MRTGIKRLAHRIGKANGRGREPKSVLTLQVPPERGPAAGFEEVPIETRGRIRPTLAQASEAMSAFKAIPDMARLLP
jgi:hypothetical protein